MVGKNTQMQEWKVGSYSPNFYQIELVPVGRKFDIDLRRNSFCHKTRYLDMKMPRNWKAHFRNDAE